MRRAVPVKPGLKASKLKKADVPGEIAYLEGEDFKRSLLHGWKDKTTVGVVSVEKI